LGGRKPRGQADSGVTTAIFLTDQTLGLGDLFNSLPTAMSVHYCTLTLIFDFLAIWSERYAAGMRRKQFVDQSSPMASKRPLHVRVKIEQSQKYQRGRNGFDGDCRGPKACRAPPARNRVEQYNCQYAVGSRSL